MDAREAEKLKPTGKGVWARNVIFELEKRNIEILRIGNHDSKKQKTSLMWHIKTAICLRNNKPDMYISPTSFIVPFLIGKKINYSRVVHDLIAFEKDKHDRKAKFIERLTLPRAARNAKFIFTVSNSTRDEFLKRFPDIEPEKVITVYSGSNINNFNYPKKRWGNEKYILSIGTLCPRKNQLRLIQAWNQIPENIKKYYKLIIVGGRGWNDKEIIDLIEKSEKVEWKGFTEFDEMMALLLNSTTFVYPSLMEGFGIPVLDAMTLGIPVITSNISSLKEISGNANLLVDPENIDNITEEIENALRSPELRNMLSISGKKRSEDFSWKKTVDLIVKYLKIPNH